MTSEVKPCNEIASCSKVLILFSSESGEFITALVRGKYMAKLGTPLPNGKHKLTIEESAYLVSIRQAFCYADCDPVAAYQEGKEPMSMLKMYHMLTQKDISLLRFSMFSAFINAGYVVKPPKPQQSGDDDSDERLKHDYDVWHYSVPYFHTNFPLPPKYRLLVVDHRFSNELPPLTKLNALSETGKGEVIMGTGYVGVYTFLSVHGLPMNIL